NMITMHMVTAAGMRKIIATRMFSSWYGLADGRAMTQVDQLRFCTRRRAARRGDGVGARGGRRPGLRSPHSDETPTLALLEDQTRHLHSVRRGGARFRTLSWSTRNGGRGLAPVPPLGC